MKHLTSLLLLSVLALPASGQTKYLGKPATAWRQELQAATPAARRDAAFALGKLGSHAVDAVDDLLARLKLGAESDHRVREAAAFALGEICGDSLRAKGYPDLLPTLQVTLKNDPDPLVRRSAAYALGCLRSEKTSVITALSAGLGDQDPRVRQNIAWALGKIGEIGEQGVGTLRKALRDQDAGVRRDAAVSAGLLADKGRALVPELLECCNFPDSEVKKAALVTLVAVVNPRDAATALQPLRQALEDADREVRFNAALGLGSIGGKDARAAVPVLVETLKLGTTEQRRAAAVALGGVGAGASAAVPSLQLALKDGDDQVRKFAAEALGSIGPAAEPAVADLLALLTRPKEPVEIRVKAAVALQGIGVTPSTRKAIPQLIEVLGNSKNPSEVRHRTLWALRPHHTEFSNYPTLFPAMARALEEPRAESRKMLRYDCAYLLGMYKKNQVPKSVLDGLAEFLDDPRVSLYKGVIRQLTGVGEADPSTAASEDLLLGDARVMVVAALREIGLARIRADRPQILNQLKTLAKNSETDPDLRKAIRKLLYDFGE